MGQTVEQIQWTVRDLDGLPQSDDTYYELIDGELFVTRWRNATPSGVSLHRKHQQIAGRISGALDAWSEASGLGEAIPAPGITPSDTNNVIPDVVWISRERLEVLEDEAGHLTGFPELIIEVLSPGEQNIRRDRQAKLKLYSVQGVQEYWIVDRFTRQVEVYRRVKGQLGLVVTVLESDALTSPLLPGFSLTVGRLF